MNPPRPDAFALYSTIFLTHRGELLMLRRAADKRFAPGRWTGLGGRVEGGEFGSLRASALRELREETGLGAEVLEGFTLRRMLVHDRPGGPLTGLLYFTAELTERVTPPCNEGTLHWKRPDELASLDVIETTATVIPRLVEDVARDPAGRDAVRLGLAHVHPTGRLASVSWSESAPCYTPGMTVSATKTTTRRDDELFGLIDEEVARQRDGLELIASENFTSPAVMEAVGSVLTNKYAEGYPGRRYYGGCEVIDRVESLAIDRVKTLFDAGWANVQPHSGSSANLAVYYALLEPGDTIMGMDLSHGGHLTHGSPVNFSGIHYRVVGYQVTRDEEVIDFDALRALALEHRPRLIIAGASAYSRTIDFARFREIADEVGAFLLADIAHIAGLVATGHHPSPLPHAHVVTSTTHKTLRGPRSGIILSNDEALGKRIDKMIFPGIQGGPLEHVIAGKAVAFFEAMQPEFKAYSQAVIDNARALSEAMAERGYRIVSGGTDNHLFVVDLRSLEMTGHKASRTLDRVHITVSKSTIPFDPEKPYYGSGIRIGSPAITTRGFTSAEMPAVAELIDRALRGDEADDVRAKVIALARRFPMP